MESIYRVRRTSEYDTTPTHFYTHSIKQAKKIAERDWEGDISWGRGASPDVFFNENELIDENGRYWNYLIESITITVIDEDDGEI